jgi:hypothetical protein
MNAKSKRIAWIAGLAAGAAALIGGVAYAVSRSSGGGGSSSTTTPPSGGTFHTAPILTFVPSTTPPATMTPPTTTPPTQNISTTNPDGNYAVHAVPNGLLVITVPAGWYGVGVIVTGGNAAVAAEAQYSPDQAAFAGPTPSGATITLKLTGLQGTVQVYSNVGGITSYANIVVA